MNAFLKKLLFASLVLMMAIPDADAQVDYQQSFGVMLKDGQSHMLPEGGNWKITFLNKDTLNNEYDKPVQILFDGALLPDSVLLSVQNIDSLLFKLPETEYSPGVFVIEEELFGYIVESDSVSKIDFSIDCLTKTKVPRVGNKVICNIFRDKLPYGFVGLVESMKVDYEKGLLHMQCDTLSYEDVYEVYYSGHVSNAPEVEEVPDSAVQQRNVIKRYNTRAASNEEKNDTVKKSGKDDFTFVLSYSEEEGKIEIGDGGDIVMKIQGHYEYQTFHSAIIDKAKGINKERMTLSLSIEHTQTLTAKKGKTPQAPHKGDMDLVAIAIPTPAPGVIIFVSLGITYDFFFGLEGSLSLSKYFGKTVGYVKDNGEYDAVLEEWKRPSAPEGFDFDPHGGASLTLKGEALLALHTKVGIAILGKALTFHIKGAVGAQIGAQLTIDGMNYDAKLNDDLEWLYKNEQLYKKFNENSFIKLDAVALYDLVFQVGEWKLEASKFLKGLGYDNKIVLNIFNVGVAPNTTEFSRKKLNGYKYEGSLESTARHLFPFDFGMMFIDRSKNAKSDGNPDYVAEDLGEFKALKERNDINFSVDLSKQKQLKGRWIGVYPFVKNMAFGGYTPMGQYDKVYVPYSLKITDVTSGYNGCVTTAEIDLDALSDKNITYAGFQIFDAESPNTIIDIKEFEMPINSYKIVHVSERGQYPNDEYLIRAFLYDSLHEYNAYTDKVKASILDFNVPSTFDATEITAVSAVLNGSVHESVYVEGKAEPERFEYTIGFEWSPPKGEYTSPLAQESSPDFSYTVTGLEPEKEYEFRSRLNSPRFYNEYFGRTLKFKTKPVFHTFTSSADYDAVHLGVFVDKGFWNQSSKDKYKFIVSEDEYTWDYGGGIIVNDNDMESRNEYPEDAVIVRIIDLKESDFEYKASDPKINVKSTKGWDPGRKYYVKCVYDDGNVRYETDVKEFTYPLPIGNFIAMPSCDDVVLNADVIYAYAKGKSQITLEYSTDKEAVRQGEATTLDVDRNCEWIARDQMMMGMAVTVYDLKPETKYYYRYHVELTVDGVTSEFTTSIESFTTTKLEYKVTLDKPLVDQNSTILKGRVNETLFKLLKRSLEEMKEVERETRKKYMVYFEVSRKKDMKEPIIFHEEFDSKEREWELELPNLEWGTKFYCRLVVETADGNKTYKSSTRELSIDEEPKNNFKAETFEAALDDEWTTLKGKVNSAVLNALESEMYGEMQFGFEYAPSRSDLQDGTDEVIRETNVTFSKATGAFTKALQLKPNTTYYYRSFVFLNDGYVYGNIVEFTTADYDAGLIVPDFDAARMRELKALEIDENRLEEVIFFNDGKMIIPTDVELKRLIKKRYERISE